jgi:hypothetical protein
MYFLLGKHASWNFLDFLVVCRTWTDQPHPKRSQAWASDSPLAGLDPRRLKQWAEELHALVDLVEEPDLSTRVWSEGQGLE